MDTALFWNLVIFLSVVLIVLALVYFTHKKNKEFIEKLRWLALERGYTLNEKPGSNKTYSLTGNTSGKQWEFYHYYKSSSSNTSSSVDYLVFESNNLTMSNTLLVGLKLGSQFKSLDIQSAIVNKMLVMVLGEEIANEIKKMNEINFGNTLEFREKFSVLVNPGSDPSKIINHSVEEFLLSEVKRGGVNSCVLALLPSKLYFKTRKTRDIKAIDNIIQNCVRILEKV